MTAFMVLLVVCANGAERLFHGTELLCQLASERPFIASFEVCCEAIEHHTPFRIELWVDTPSGRQLWIESGNQEARFRSTEIEHSRFRMS